MRAFITPDRQQKILLTEIDIESLAPVGSALRMIDELVESLDTSAIDVTDPDALDFQRKIYNTLSHQYEVVKLTSDSEPTFQVTELAEVPLLNGISQIRRGHKESAPPTEDV